MKFLTENITKRGIWYLCFSVLVIIVVVMYILSQSSENDHTTLPPYTHFLKIPEQKKSTYPIIFESEGLMDYSSIIVFEVDSEWIKDFVQNNGLSPQSPPIAGIEMIAYNVKKRGLKQISDVIDSNTWNCFNYQSMQFLSNGNTYGAYFELYTNITQTTAILHFFSFTRKSNVKAQRKRTSMSRFLIDVPQFRFLHRKH